MEFTPLSSCSINDLYLHIHQSPNSTFYKDEGGKSNYLSASCFLSFKNTVPTNGCFSSSSPSLTERNLSHLSNNGQTPIGNVILRPQLVYENGTGIEDEADIFNILYIEPKTVTSTMELFTVKFRIEKVSRRKDGKLFRVKFEVDEKKSNVLSYISLIKTKPVITSPVTVLSKRKSLSSKSSSKEKPHKPKKNQNQVKNEPEPLACISKSMSNVSLADNNNSFNTNSNGMTQRKSTIELPVSFLIKMRDNMVALEQRVGALTERVAYLERQKNLSVNRPHRGHSLLFESAFEGEYINHSPSLNSITNSFSDNNPILMSSSEGIKRNNSSAQELFEFLASSTILN